MDDSAGFSLTERKIITTAEYEEENTGSVHNVSNHFTMSVIQNNGLRMNNKGTARVNTMRVSRNNFPLRGARNECFNNFSKAAGQ